MKALIAICVFMLTATAAAAAQKPGPWLGIFKSKDGYSFQGHLGRTPFSFDIPGNQIKVAQQQGSDDPAAMTVIDGIFFSVMPVRKSEFPSTSPDVLISYRNWEQQYEKKHFGRLVLSDLKLCKGTSLGHESWELRTLDVKAPAQVYMATEAGNDVILISSAFEGAGDKKEMLSKFSHLCKTFKVG